jgi:hypothetical protein
VVGAIAAVWFLTETYRTMLAPTINGVLFMLWFVALFAVFAAVTFVSNLVLIALFPPVWSVPM